MRDWHICTTAFTTLDIHTHTPTHWSTSGPPTLTNLLHTMFLLALSQTDIEFLPLLVQVLESYYVLEPDVPKDASTEVTCILRALDQSVEILDSRGVKVPEHLVIEAVELKTVLCPMCLLLEGVESLNIKTTILNY